MVMKLSSTSNIAARISELRGEVVESGCFAHALSYFKDLNASAASPLRRVAEQIVLQQSVIVIIVYW